MSGDGHTGQLAEASRPQSLADAACVAIRGAITQKTFPPGLRPTETGLARQLKVSKMPVREAPLRLRQVALIEPTGGRGGRVTSSSAERLTDAFQVRGAIEPFTARLAAERALVGQRRAIESAALGSMEAASAGEIELFRHHDGTLHRLIAEAIAERRGGDAARAMHQHIASRHEMRPAREMSDIERAPAERPQEEAQSNAPSHVCHRQPLPSSSVPCSSAPAAAMTRTAAAAVRRTARWSPFGWACLPIEGLEPLYIAVNRGYFEEEGIRVEPQQAQGAAAIIPAVISGDMQFGFSNNVSLILATERGLHCGSSPTGRTDRCPRRRRTSASRWSPRRRAARSTTPRTSPARWWPSTRCATSGRC